MEVLRPEVLKLLEDVGITVEKKRTKSSRVIVIRNNSNNNSNGNLQ